MQTTASAETGQVARSLNLTICTVAYQSRHLLHLQRDLLARLNPGLEPRWIVVDNTPGQNPLRVSKGGRFDLLPGVKRPRLAKGFASLQHGKALNRALRSVDTRYVMILDPDFFVVRPWWLRDVLQHMMRRRLAFLGAPWHPRWYRKWRYFPCAHCVLIDTQLATREELDYLPELSRQPRPYGSPFLHELEWMWVRGQRLQACCRALRHFRITLEEDRRRRLVVGSSRDTGIRVFDRFARRPGIRWGSFTPVYRPGKDRLIPPPDVRIDTRSPLRGALEKLRPDWLSFYPRRRGSFSRNGFSAYGLPDLHAKGWEEFLWKGEPFGFHVRASQKAPRDPEKLASEVRAHIELILNAPGRSSR